MKIRHKMLSVNWHWNDYVICQYKIQVNIGHFAPKISGLKCVILAL